MKILLSWIGLTDIRASENTPGVGLGPIGQAVTDRQFDSIVLLTNLDRERNLNFTRWLKTKTEAPIDLRTVKLSGPTEFGEIYKIAVENIKSIKSKHKNDLALTIHLSPGTPAMSAVWIIIAKTLYPAELIETSLQAGLRTVSIPFDLSAEFLPDLIRRTDEQFEKVSADFATAAEFGDIIYQSPKMRSVIEKSQLIAPHNVPVLIEGESGTGKELFAKAIHRASPRNGSPFIPVNCGAIPSELVESELFGHLKGSFTGAHSNRDGVFKEADGGTIFLDEIGELPLKAQVRMLRVLQEKEITPVGATKPQKIDVRVISATNRNLIKEVSGGNFREDLFYRLAVFPLYLPPLREREGDLSLLINHFLDILNKDNVGKFWKEEKKLSPGARNSLLRHSWVGNIRELQNTILRVAVLSRKTTISEADVDQSLFSTRPDQPDQILHRSLGDGFNIQNVLAEVVDHYLNRALNEAHQNKTKAAELVGLPNYQTFDNWLKRFNR